MTKELKEMNALQTDVFLLLPFGIDKAITTKDIRNILKIDERYVREIIVELIIVYGIPVGSLRQNNNSGYFIATNNEEKNIGTHSLNQVAQAIQLRVDKVKSADVNTSYQYREHYKDKQVERDEQLDLMAFIDTKEKEISQS